MANDSKYSIEEFDTGETIEYEIKCDQRIIAFVGDKFTAEQVLEELQMLEAEIKDLKRGEEYCRDNH